MDDSIDKIEKIAKKFGNPVSKRIWIDLETTGVDVQKHAIFEISGLVEISGEIKEEFQILSRPHDGAMVSAKALEITDKTISELKGYPDNITAHNSFCSILDRYIDKFNRNDKFLFCGYNAHFDFEFLLDFFDRCGDKYFGSYMNYTPRIDVYHLISYLYAEKIIDVQNVKLSTIADFFGIEINAHDGLSDIKATYEIYKILKSKLNYSG